VVDEGAAARGGIVEEAREPGIGAADGAPIVREYAVARARCTQELRFPAISAADDAAAIEECRIGSRRRVVGEAYDSVAAGSIDRCVEGLGHPRTIQDAGAADGQLTRGEDR